MNKVLPVLFLTFVRLQPTCTDSKNIRVEIEGSIFKREFRKNREERSGSKISVHFERSFFVDLAASV